MSEKISFSIKDTNIAKGVAVCLMLFHHCFLSADRYEGFDISFFPLTEGRVLELAKFAKICVGIFAFLSAYGMAKSYSKICDKSGKQISRFIFRRYIKLMTGFWAAYIVCVLGCALFSRDTCGPWIRYGAGLEGFLYSLIDLSGLAYLLNAKPLIQTWWYISFAIVLIFLFPLLEAGFRKMGWAFLAVVCLFPYIIGDGDFLEPYIHWVAVGATGILCADSNIFEHIKSTFLTLNRYIKLLSCVVLCAGWYPIILLRDTILYSKAATVVDSFIAFYIVLFCYLVLGMLPLIRSVFAFLGRYSMNIFLIHSFIRSKWFYGYTYSYRNVFLIWLMLLVESLLVSVILEWLKEVLRYNLLCQKLIAKIEGGSYASKIAVSGTDPEKTNKSKA